MMKLDANVSGRLEDVVLYVRVADRLVLKMEPTDRERYYRFREYLADETSPCEFTVHEVFNTLTQKDGSESFMKNAIFI